MRRGHAAKPHGGHHTECCDEPSEDCSSGYPRTCNAGCAALFLPFWDECQLVLGKDIHNFEPVVQLCMAADGSSAPGSSGGSSLPFPVNGSLAQQLNVQCTDGTAAVDCIPECNAARHGFILLLNIEGNDSKLSCELHFELYSWIGAASDGGYIGTDFGSFFSAVVAGAAGTYFSTLTESHHVHTDLSCQPGQAVFMNRRRPLPGLRAYLGQRWLHGRRGRLALAELSHDRGCDLRVARRGTAQRQRLHAGRRWGDGSAGCERDFHGH